MKSEKIHNYLITEQQQVYEGNKKHQNYARWMRFQDEPQACVPATIEDRMETLELLIDFQVIPPPPDGASLDDYVPECGNVQALLQWRHRKIMNALAR